MRLQAPAALFLAGILSSASAAAHDLEAGVTWKLEFGASALQPSASLTVGYQSSDLAAPPAGLASMELTGSSASAKVAGLSVFSRIYEANQSGDDPAVAPEPASTPWYSRSWVLWTVGGIAASAALATSGSSGDENTCAPGGTCNQDCTGNTLSTCNGQFCVQDDQNCVPTSSAGISYADRHASSDKLGEHIDAALDEGNGGMGDLAVIK